MRACIISLLLFLTGTIFSQESGWVWQNPKPQGNTINSMYFLNETTGFMAGDAGIVLKTVNGGTSWQIISTPLVNNIYGIQFVNNSTGFICGNGILKTIDGGNIWVKVLSVEFFFTSLSMINNLTGFFTGYTGTQGMVYRTTDGGSTFQQTNFGSIMLSGITFTNAVTGYLTGNSALLYKTTNEGGNWTAYSISGSPKNVLSNSFIDNNTGFAACSDGSIGKTINGGVNWNWVNSNTSTVFKIYCLNLNDAYGVSSNGQVIKTVDGGSSWNVFNTGELTDLKCLFFMNGNTGFIAGRKGNILKTNNAGFNWSKQNNGVTFSEINSGSFADQNTGYFFSASELIKTTDQGLSWIKLSIDTPSFMTGGYVFNPNTIVAFGYNFVKRSTNGGTSWASFVIPQNNLINCAYFLNENTGYLGAAGNKILKTTNGGANWLTYYPAGSPSSLSILGFEFVNDSNGFGCSSNGYVVRTTNYGKTWVANNLAFANSFNDIDFVNQTTGFLCGTSNIFKTTNSGINWLRYDIPFAGIFYSIHFTDNNTGFIAGSLGKLYKSTNGGVNWYQLRSNCSEYIFNLAFVDEQTGFAFGRNGTILKTTNAGGQFVGISEPESAALTGYSLSQNYPNPFNPVTNIRFDIPVGNGRDHSVKLVIYDLLGREITTLVNQQMQPGSYSVDWDASNYPSGVYFYRIEAGGYKESKRMVLIK